MQNSSETNWLPFETRSGQKVKLKAGPFKQFIARRLALFCVRSMFLLMRHTAGPFEQAFETQNFGRQGARREPGSEGYAGEVPGRSR